MVKVLAVIPTIGESPLLPDLLHLLGEEKVDVLLLINRDGVVFTTPATTNVLWLPGLSIYREWNLGVGIAQRAGYDVAAILNDDIELAPGALRRAAGLLVDSSMVAAGLDYFDGAADRQPALRQVRGTYRHGGVGGFAFLVKPEFYLGVDEQFEWWGGDDDLMFQYEAQGHTVGIADGCPVTHVSETTARRHLWTYEARARDRERFEAKYPGRAW